MVVVVYNAHDPTGTGPENARRGARAGSANKVWQAIKE